jgi:hypothetical protein
MQLHRPIPLQKSVEQWLSRLQESVAETIRMDIYSCVKDIDNGLPFEELVSKVFIKKTILIKEQKEILFSFLVYMSSIISRFIVCMDT